MTNEKTLLGHAPAPALAFLASLPDPPPPSLRTHLVVAAFLHRDRAVCRAARAALKASLPAADDQTLSRQLAPDKQKNARRWPGGVASAWLEALEGLGLDLAVLAPIIRTRLRAGDRLCAERGYISGDVFLRGFVKGTTLQATADALSAIPAEIGALTHLRRLDVQGCGLTALPVEIECLHSLEVLDLKDNHLTDLGIDLRALPRLKTLNLNGNPLQTLPKGLLALPDLRRLFLSGPCIETAAFADIGRLTCLEELGLLDTARDVLPDSMGQLASLQVLTLFQTKIHTIPASMGRLPLKALDVSFTPLRTIPDFPLSSTLGLTLMATGMSAKQKDALRARFSRITFF